MPRSYALAGGLPREVAVGRRELEDHCCEGCVSWGATACECCWVKRNATDYIACRERARLDPNGAFRRLSDRLLQVCSPAPLPAAALRLLNFTVC